MLLQDFVIDVNLCFSLLGHPIHLKSMQTGLMLTNGKLLLIIIFSVLLFVFIEVD